MNLNDLTPAPWRFNPSTGLITSNNNTHVVASSCDEEDGEFISKARQAFDIMMRRGICPVRCKDGKWTCLKEHLARLIGACEGKIWEGASNEISANDPFTALILADEFLKREDK